MDTIRAIEGELYINKTGLFFLRHFFIYIKGQRINQQF